MDADVLRLILFLAGIALILGIYLWDRRKRAGLRVHARHRKAVEPQLGDDTATSPAPATEALEVPPRHEPIWRRSAEPLPEAPPPEPDPGVEVEEEEALKQLEDMVQEAHDTAVPEKAEQITFEFEAEEADEAVVADMDNRDLPQKLLQLNVRVRASGRVSGDTILRGAEACGLVPGEMQIFHRYPETGGRHPLFSMASLVEPGVFPLDRMDAFSTPGITLFAQLPGPLEAMQTFDEMLSTAQQLAQLFGAEIQDETHSDLSRQTIEHMREEIQEYGRQLRLARIRQ